jgi:ribosomal protein S18 acetylase RimI-like enzyme
MSLHRCWLLFVSLRVSEVLNVPVAPSRYFRLATTADLPVLARIHKQAYSRKHFTALLTNETLERYYGYFLGDGSEVLLAVQQATDGAETALGFAVYGRAIPERIARFKREASRDVLVTSLRHPLQAFLKLSVALWSKLVAAPACKPADFLLLSIAVSHKGGGTGGRLLRAMLAGAHKAGVKTVGLYVNADNLNAINAYFAAGFVLRHYQSGQFYMEADSAVLKLP